MCTSYKAEFNTHHSIGVAFVVFILHFFIDTSYFWFASMCGFLQDCFKQLICVHFYLLLTRNVSMLVWHPNVPSSLCKTGAKCNHNSNLTPSAANVSCGHSPTHPSLLRLHLTLSCLPFSPPHWTKGHVISNLAVLHGPRTSRHLWPRTLLVLFLLYATFTRMMKCFDLSLTSIRCGRFISTVWINRKVEVVRNVLFISNQAYKFFVTISYKFGETVQQPKDPNLKFSYSPYYTYIHLYPSM